MKRLTVIQHTSAEYLGYLEDHFELRGVGFRYVRPFTEGSEIPDPRQLEDGLVLLGGGPWGAAGGRDAPSLRQEVAITRYALDAGLPILAIGLGAQILSLAAGGAVEPAPLTFEIGESLRVDPQALEGWLPERAPRVVYMRDWPAPPEYARVLARDERGRTAVFQIGGRALGFVAHPAFKAAMAEDLVMEFEETPNDPGPTLERLRAMRREIQDALSPTVVGVVKTLGLMD
ncbi:MAG: gamma-glutamyl-gamma-aminobutyrate hydrolase family protein [Pseudomonadota bacterium]|nr:gamma-glutamyl-gamma-aminobutyrate hydrolase family protein [Pseudomonadota bacterium]